MSWIPEFKLGLWNAWILMLYYPLHPLIFFIADKAVGTGDIFKKMGNPPYERWEKFAINAAMVISFLMLFYSLFLPLKIGTSWFYIGLLIYLPGFTAIMAAIVNIVTTPLGQPFVKGVYHFSRHPMLFSMFITFIGISLATISWVFLVLSIAVFVLEIFEAIAEERGCLELYGNQYQNYMDNTPRWIGIPKSK